jgi:YNFM family putative membrane transporter
VGFLLGAAGMFATMYSTQAILPELSDDFDVTPSRAGLTISAVVASVAIASWFWGPLSDRIGRPRAIRLASWLLVLPSLGVALAPTFSVLLVCRALQGLCMPGLLVVGAPYVVETLVPRLGERVMGWYVGALVLGGLVGRVGVALATDLVGWRVAIGALVVLPLAGAIRMGGDLLESGSPARSGRPLTRLVDIPLLAVTAMGSALFFAFVGTFTFVVYRLQEPPFDLGLSTASLVFFLWLAGAIGPFAGRLAERFGWRRLTGGAIALSTLGTVLSLPNVLPVLVVGLACIACAMFVGYTASMLGVSAVTRADRGAASAFFFSVYYAVGALGAYLPGVAWERSGWHGVVACSLTSLAIAVVAALALSRRERLRAAPSSA